MNTRRFASAAAASCVTVVLAGWVMAWPAGFGLAGIEDSGAAAVADQHAASLAADTESAVVPDATKAGTAAVGNADLVPAVESVKEAVTATGPVDERQPTVEAALTDSSQMLPPVQTAVASTHERVPNELGGDKAGDVTSSIEILDECLVAEVCIDRYLWTLYQRTPKEDTIKVHDRRKVTVKRRGRWVTVTRSFTRLVDEDFTWKDPRAAEKAGMPMMDYVIGGMHRSFKVKLFHVLHAAEQAGLSPGITSAFRDDYRQSIASGLKAASDRSYHGGSLRGGYGHGLAADVVSVKGETRDQRWSSSEKLWKWIDAHGKEFGIGRPYLDRDPPHLAPIDGKEYAAHHGGTKTHHAASRAKKRHHLAGRDDRGSKRAKTARSSKVRTI